MSKKFSIILGLIVVFTMILSACQASQSGEVTEPTEIESGEQSEESGEEAEAPSSYSEAPMLAEMVESGDLPAVEDRLPENPVVVETGTLMPAEYLELEIGRYTEQLVQSGTWGFGVVLREPLWVTSNLDSDLQPGIIEEWSFNDDNTEFTFKIREGLRWSDGVLVTTDDVAFAINDVLFNEELTPNLAPMYRSGGTADGTPMVFEVIDDLTFKISFDQPYGSFIDMLALNEFIGYEIIIKPMHYLSQFHATYTAVEDMAAAMEEESVETWYDLFSAKDMGSWQAMDANKIGMPVLNPWMSESVGDGKIVAVRNPYYYMVDAEGNQLPYIDRLVGIDLPEESEYESTLMMAMAGDIDFASGGFADVSLLLENEADVYTMTEYNDNASRSFFINLTYGDEAFREVVLDIRFREAINMAIDREEIIEDVYGGLGNPTEVTSNEYNPDRANELLDEMGMTEYDDEGFRLDLQGNRFEIQAELGPWPEYYDPIPIIADHLADVGIRLTYEQISSELLNERIAANEIQGRYDWVRANTWIYRHNHDWLPDDRWAPLWNDWFTTNGTEGEEPPEWVMELYAINEKINASVPGTSEDAAAMDELYQWYEENIPYFIIIDGPVYPNIINNRIQNVPSEGYGHAMSRVYKVLFATYD